MYVVYHRSKKNVYQCDVRAAMYCDGSYPTIILILLPSKPFKMTMTMNEYCPYHVFRAAYLRRRGEQDRFPRSAQIDNTEEDTAEQRRPRKTRIHVS